MARAAGPGSGAVSERAGESNAATPQCRFAAGRVRVVVAVDSSPQAYQRLERAAIEASQKFGTRRFEGVPHNVGGVGVDAYWFPSEGQLQATDGVRLITATVHRPGASRARRQALGVAVARPYLGPDRPPR